MITDTATDTDRLVRYIDVRTGYDARVEPVFELATDKACSRCGQVRATAMIIDGWNDEPAERSCVDCID